MAPGTSAVSVDQLRPFSGRLPMAWSSTTLPSAAPVWSNSTLLAVTVISSLRLDGEQSVAVAEFRTETEKAAFAAEPSALQTHRPHIRHALSRADRKSVV